MKEIILLSLALTVAATGQAQKIKGSDTMLPLSQKEAESFIKVNP